MALMDFIKKQFIDVIQWTEDGDGTLAWRFPMSGMEIQNGGQLVVPQTLDCGSVEDVGAGARRVEAADEVHQRRLAAA